MNISRRRFLGSCAAGTAAAIGSPFLRAVDATEPTRKPNVIVLFIDDLGYGDIGAFGCTDIPTPNIDSLARDGVRCTNGYTLCPVCSPSRAGIMTGLYPQRFGVNGNNHRGCPIPRNHDTIAHVMRDAGYATGLVARWDLGDGKQGPLQVGFREVARRTPMPNSDPRCAITPGPGPTYLEEDGSYITDHDGDMLADFVVRHKDEPFFLHYAPLAVHYPVSEVPEKYLARVPFRPKRPTSAQKRSLKGTRFQLAGTLIALDDAIGKLLARLREHRLDEHTLIFFTGDNGGDSACSEARNLPLRGSKAKGYDGGVHEPFIVRWTGNLPAGTDFAGAVCTFDILTTAAAAAGAQLRGSYDGVDLMPFLKGKKTGHPHETLFWRWLDNRPNVKAVRAGDWRLEISGGEKPNELYNLAEDPGQTKNLAAERPDRVAELTQLYGAWEKSLPPVAPRGDNRSAGIPRGRGWATTSDTAPKTESAANSV